MPSIGSRLGDAVDRLSAHGLWNYALVPLFLGALNTRQISNVLGSRYDFHAGISFGVPIPVTDAWAFVSTPTSGGGIQVGPSETVGVALFALGIVLQGVLLAGYLGGMTRALRGKTPKFGAAIGEYWLPFLGFALVLLAMFLPPALLVLGSAELRWLVVFWLLAFVVGGYLLYAAPYLVVLHDVDLSRALGWSVSLATSEAAYLRFAVGYALLVLGISVPATVIVANFSIVGVLVGVAGLAPVGLVFDTTTLVFVGDLTDADGFGNADDRPHRAALSLPPEDARRSDDSSADSA